MRRVPKIVLITGASIVGLAVVLVVAALIVLQTGWFRNFVRTKIVAAVEEGTGGRAEVGNFGFSLMGLRAEVDDFVLHGTEEAGRPPLVRAKSIVVGLKIISALHHEVNLDLLEIDEPQVAIEVRQDGTTNIPEPKTKSDTKSDPLQTVMKLAVRHFSIRNGLVAFEDRKTPLNVEGDNLSARMVYEALVPRYVGTISIAPVYVQQGSRPRLPVKTNIAFAIRGTGIDITSARFETPESKMEMTASVNDISNPRASVRMSARVAPAELGRTFGVETGKLPAVEISLAAGVEQNTANLLGLQVASGGSRLEASGHLSDLKAMAGSVRFNGQLALGELGKVFAVSARPEGTVTLAGDAKLRGTGNYDVAAKIDAPNVSFLAGATRLPVNAHADVSAKPDLIAVSPIRVRALGGEFNGRAELAAMDRLRVDGTLNNFDTRYLAREYASRNVVWDGVISGPIHAEGRLKGPLTRDLVATARLGIRPGPNGVPLAGLIDVAYNGRNEQVNFGNSFIQLPSTRLTFAGALGRRLDVTFRSRNLNDLLPAIAMTSPNPPQTLPVTLGKGGTAAFNGTVTGTLSNPQVAGHVALTNFAANGQALDRFAADLGAQSTGADVRNLLVSGQGIEAKASGSIGLKNWKPVDASAVAANVSLRSGNVHDLLTAAGKGDAPFSGALTADARVSGTFGDPRGAADVAVANGKAGDEPFSRIQAHVDYAGQVIELSKAEAVTPAGRIDLNASFRHPLNRFDAGNVQFRLTSTPIELRQLRTVQERQPGLKGTVNLQAEGNAELLAPAANRERFRFGSLNANLSARSVVLNAKQLGNVVLTANTAGQNLTFRLDSDLASSSIRGEGKVQLAGDYPLEAKLALHPIKLAPVMRLASTGPQPEPPAWDGIVDGTLTISGPISRPLDMKGRLELGTVEVTTAAPPTGAEGARRPLTVRNSGPIVVTLDRQVVRIESARLTGPSTNLTATGTVALAQPQKMDLHADGNVGLELARTFSPDIFASGNLAIKADVSGTPAQPSVNGRMELVNTSVNYLDAPNGLSNANGVIVFNGNQASIESLTGESGGGKVALSGVVRYGGPQTNFRLRATANRVRVRQSSISVQVNAGLDFTGTPVQSILSGDVTILQVGVHSHTDFGSVLAPAAPASAPSAETGMLGNMRLDVRINTSPSVQFQTSLSQNLQADAHLQLRGTAAQPGMLGRVVVTQGDVVFFGSKYTINQGTVNFYDPSRILPVLNVDLETSAQGVDVTLSLSGPVDNLKLSYHSDPPLAFSDIVSLLASGKPPSSDPVLAASQPQAPQQSWEQMGASAVLGQALANPVSGRLQRLFGVTKLKIDPQVIGGGANTLQATLSMQQQITREVTFTYMQDVSSSNPQVIRIEWAIDPTWSAIALRQENGQFGIDLFYKKRFR